MRFEEHIHPHNACSVAYVCACRDERRKSDEELTITHNASVPPLWPPQRIRFSPPIGRVLPPIWAATGVVGSGAVAEIQSRLETADSRSQQITSALAAIEAQRIDDEQIKEVLTGFANLWQSLPPKEQVRLVRLLIESVTFDGPGGNVAITFHPTGLKTLTENQLEYAQ
ncbi:MAG: hypothetical protein NTW52_20290 [Planctomycetota bacterium]|nr:hypothetical protein [Planctomycetota bacterium]